MAINKLEKNKTYHLIGIGGTGMSALAKALLSLNINVSGSDIKESLSTIKLKDIGAKIFVGHDSKNIKNADIIVISTAIEKDNPELKQAQEERRPVIHRSDLLAAFIHDNEKSIVITGTHGKTTTSAMLTQALDSCLKQTPNFIIGSTLNNYNSNSHIADTPYGVYEADESDGSFVKFFPHTTLITNLEAEHLEHYGSETKLFTCFETHINSLLAQNKNVIINQDCKNLNRITAKISHPNLHKFGLKNPEKLEASQINAHKKGISCTLLHNKESHTLNLQLFGQQNLENALAVLTAIQLENLSLENAYKSLSQFNGTKRRSEWIGQEQNVDIYDDYAHHPSEIHCTLKGLKESLKRPLLCIFQPHRYSRTRDLLQDFPQAFEFADSVIITDIFSANEERIPNITGQHLSDLVQEKWPNKKVFFFKQKSAIAIARKKFLQKNQLIITMGAGNIYTVGKELLHQLKQDDQKT